MELVTRIHIVLRAAGHPVESVGSVDPLAGTANLKFEEAATAQQQDAARAFLKGLDYSKLPRSQEEQDRQVARTAIDALITDGAVPAKIKLAFTALRTALRLSDG